MTSHLCSTIIKLFIIIGLLLNLLACANMSRQAGGSGGAPAMDEAADVAEEIVMTDDAASEANAEVAERSSAADTSPAEPNEAPSDDRVKAATGQEITAKEEEARHIFKFDDTINADELAWACRVAVGLDKLATDFQLEALTYYYRGTNQNDYERLGAGLILGNSLLTVKGIPCAGEGDLKNAVAMKIMDVLGAGGSYTEFCAMDFRDNFLLMGHDGPAHLAISDKKPMLRGLGLYHGKAGFGISVEFNVQTGPVTILTCTQTRAGQLKFLTAEGESIPGPTMKIGNTNSRIKFDLSPAEFVDTWCSHAPTHHCALGLGHVAEKLLKFGRLSGLELVKVG